MADESFEYGIKKDVRNNPVVREIDRERHRDMWRGLGVGLFVLAVLVFSVWRQAELLRQGYDIDELQRQLDAEREIGRELQLEIETLRSPLRVEHLATKMGMTPPGADDHEVIQVAVPDTPPDRSVVASRLEDADRRDLEPRRIAAQPR